LACFNCAVCRRQLNTGDRLYVLADGSFICKEDFASGNFGPGLDGECGFGGD
jgi:hypothetical protein